MTRNGKIARLPKAVRDTLNRRLRDGEPGKRLVAWLNPQPEVQAVLAAEFGGRPITENNLSEWKTGGFREWELQQDALERARVQFPDHAEFAAYLAVARWLAGERDEAFAELLGLLLETSEDPGLAAQQRNLRSLLRG